VRDLGHAKRIAWFAFCQSQPTAACISLDDGRITLQTCSFCACAEAWRCAGTFLYRTTPAVPSTQRVLARPRAALRCDGVLSGELRVRDASVHTVIMDTHGRLSHLHTWLRLRSTVPAANNRLDVRSMVSVDDGGAEPEEPADDFNAYSEEAGLGWHAAHGGLGGWNDGVVRTHTRGLTPYVFVPWDELDASDLNKSAEEMDYYVPG
jgi:F-box protein 9